MSNARRHPPLSGLVLVAGLLSAACDGPAELVATGFGFTEGPVWDAARGELYFTDLNDDCIRVVGKDGEVSVWTTPSGVANGLALDAEGRLIACCGGARELRRYSSPDQYEVLASDWQGKRLNSPNDLCLDQHGGIWFSDPRFGNGDGVELERMAVYYLSAAGELSEAISDMQRPNGVILSLDGSGLYVAEPDQSAIRFYPVLGPGRVGEGREIFRSEEDGPGPDGFAVDERGRLYSTWRGILVHEPDGSLIRRIPVPEHTANCCFGGPELKTLFVTARRSVYRIELDVRGAAAAHRNK